MFYVYLGTFVMSLSLLFKTLYYMNVSQLQNISLYISVLLKQVLLATINSFMIYFLTIFISAYYIRYLYKFRFIQNIINQLVFSNSMQLTKVLAIKTILIFLKIKLNIWMYCMMLVSIYVSIMTVFLSYVYNEGLKYHNVFFQFKSSIYPYLKFVSRLLINRFRYRILINWLLLFGDDISFFFRDDERAYLSIYSSIFDEGYWAINNVIGLAILLTYNYYYKKK